MQEIRSDGREVRSECARIIGWEIGPDCARIVGRQVWCERARIVEREVRPQGAWIVEREARIDVLHTRIHGLKIVVVLRRHDADGRRRRRHDGCYALYRGGVKRWCRVLEWSGV